jgi:RNA polymerase sigma-70 factor, ECF subfamily
MSVDRGIASQAGDDQESEDKAFRVFFERYFGAILRFFLRRGLRRDEAEDLTQETFLRAYRGIAHFRMAGSEAFWVFRIANNVYANELRHRSAARRTGPSSPPAIVEMPDLFPAGTELGDEGLVTELGRGADLPSTEKLATEEVLGKEQAKAIRVALAELPPQMRRCFELSFFQELNSAEVAAILKISPGTVRSHLLQGRRRLADKLASLALKAPSEPKKAY